MTVIPAFGANQFFRKSIGDLLEIQMKVLIKFFQ
jgi:hypothetical protein